MTPPEDSKVMFNFAKLVDHSYFTAGIYIYIYIQIDIFYIYIYQYVPHKMVVEVSKTGNL